MWAGYSGGCEYYRGLLTVFFDLFPTLVPLSFGENLPRM